MENINNQFARSIWEVNPTNINFSQENLSNLIKNNNDPLVANFLRSQMIARGNSLNKSSMFNFDGFLEKVEEEKKKLIEVVTLNFEKKSREIKLDKIQVINFDKEDDEDDPCHIYMCPICSSFKSVYPVQCFVCERIHCVECSKIMIAKEQGCSCGLKPYKEKEIGPTTRQTIDKFKIKCPNLENPCSKIMNFERINYHLSQDCLNIAYQYTCKHCKVCIETNFWEMEKLRDHLIHCPEIKVKCEFCETDVIRKNINEHYENCDLRKITCDDCGREMVFADYKNKHSKSVCIEIIKNKYDIEKQAIKEENQKLRNENDKLKLEIENKKLEIQNNNCVMQTLTSEMEDLNKKIKEKEHKLEANKIEYEKTINNLMLKLKEEIKKKDEVLNQVDKMKLEHQVTLNNLKEQYEKTINDLMLKLKEEIGIKEEALNQVDKMKLEHEVTLNNLQEQFEKEKNDESNNILNLLTKSEELKTHQKEVIHIDLPQRTIYYKNGLKYIGDINDNKENGEGTLYSLRFYKIYEGKFINGKKSGRGIQYNPDFIYNGYFDNDKRNGEGIFFRIGNTDKFEKYVGYWKDDKKTGFGKQYDDLKLVYEGNFLNDKYDGMGILYLNNGYYEGQLSENKKNGRGIFYFTGENEKNIRYEGFWKDDVKYGEYKLIDKDGKIIKQGLYGKK